MCPVRSVTYVSGRSFDLKKLESLGRAFGFRPNAWDVKRKSVVRKLLKGKFFWRTCSESNKLCHKYAVPRLDFRAAGSLLVPAERAFRLRDLTDHSIRNPMLGYAHTRVTRSACLVSSGATGLSAVVDSDQALQPLNRLSVAAAILCV